MHRSAWKGYSPKFAGTEFSEVREESCNKYCICVLRCPFFGEYGANVTWPRRPPRKGVGQPPTLLLDQGRPPNKSTKEEKANACEIRPPTDAYGAIGTIHDRVSRGGGNAGHVAHYGTASANPLKRQLRQQRRGRGTREYARWSTRSSRRAPP